MHGSTIAQNSNDTQKGAKKNTFFFPAGEQLFFFTVIAYLNINVDKSVKY